MTKPDFQTSVSEATDDELREMYRNLPTYQYRRQGRIRREMEVRNLLAEDTHRGRTAQHMDTVERQARWQLLITGSSLGFGLVRLGVAFSAGALVGRFFG